MLGLCWDKTYSAMKNHNERDENGDNNRNKDENDNGNVASRL